MATVTSALGSQIGGTPSETPAPSASGSQIGGISSITSAPSASETGSQSQTSSGSSDSSSSQPPQTHTVKAGAGGFKFDPPELTANVGDTVTFEFYPPDHSVARAEFGSACVPYEYTGKGKQGFWSDTQWVKDVNHLTYFNITVNSTEPIFYYCAAPESCTGHQMVGVINPNDTQTLDKQIIAAKEATFQVKPGDPIPGEATSSLLGPTASSTQPSSSSNGSHGHTLSGGAIAGIVVGGIAFLAICAALFFYVGRTKSLKEVIKHKEVTSPNPNNGGFGGPQSPGFPPTPQAFSPNMGHAEMGGQLPMYGQHNATDSHYSGGFGQQQGYGQVAEMKQEYSTAAELASPTPGQQTFTAELEAPGKATR